MMAAMLFVTACSDDDVNPSPELAGPLYGLEKGTPGSVDELIYKTWEHSGVYYLYNYSDDAFLVSNWSGHVSYTYTPVKEENIEAVRQVVSHINDNVLGGMDGDFIRRNWYVRVFMCDELLDLYDRAVTDVYVENADILILPNVNGTMLAKTDDEWTKWATSLSDLLISRLYLGATVQPTAFLALRPKGANGRELSAIYTDEWITDPDGRYSPNMYTFRTKGYVKSRATSVQNESVMVVKEQQDVADFINFLTKTSKEELEWNWSHFDALKQRALVLIPYLYDELGLDLDQMQNSNAPEDPVPAGYFKNLK